MDQGILRSIRAYLKMEKESGISEYLFSSKRKEEQMLSLKNETTRCQRCPLAKERKNVVFGSGSIYARLM
ncbi:MAG: uracil-DNA glycosylase, partial [Candidatus Omnitrophota bacterium]